MRAYASSVVACLLLACGCGGPQATRSSGAPPVATHAAKQPDISGMRVLMVIGQRDFRDEELFKPQTILGKAGAEVIVASSSLDEAKGMLGGRAQPDVVLSDVDPSDFHAIIFVGGVGAKQYWDDDTAHDLARREYEQGRIVAAICLAPVILANAGLLDGKKATVWKTEAGRLRAQGADYTGAAVEVDGRIITGNGPEAAAEFAAAIAEAMASMKEQSSA